MAKSILIINEDEEEIKELQSFFAAEGSTVFCVKTVDDAINEANRLQIKGKDTTPFLLKAIADATQNKSLDANIALIYNNAKVGANIAKEYCKLK